MQYYDPICVNVVTYMQACPQVLTFVYYIVQNTGKVNFVVVTSTCLLPFLIQWTGSEEKKY